jgi:hypothetical protein
MKCNICQGEATTFVNGRSLCSIHAREYDKLKEAVRTIKELGWKFKR